MSLLITVGLKRLRLRNKFLLLSVTNELYLIQKGVIVKQKYKKILGESSN